MIDISIEKLKALALITEEWNKRYDIEKSVYDELLNEHTKVHQFIESNPSYFKSEEEYKEAYSISSFIMICLLTRINEIKESEGR